MNRTLFTNLTVLSLNLFASQGFHTYMESLPKAVYLWKNRTFQVSIYDPKTNSLGRHFGTAFIVHTDERYSYFITAKHVAENCKSQLKFRCQVSIETDIDTNEFKKTDNVKLGTSDRSLVFDVIEVRVFEPSSSNSKWSADALSRDIGYLRVNRIDPGITGTIDINENISFNQNEIPANTEFQRKHFIIGYPYMNSRWSYNGKYDNNFLKIRWSEGDYIKRGLDQKKNRRFYSDADSLVGNSGGPVIAEDGTIIGILVGGPIVSGNEYVSIPRFNSYVVPYDYVKIMIGDILLGNKETKTIFKAD